MTAVLGHSYADTVSGARGIFIAAHPIKPTANHCQNTQDIQCRTNHRLPHTYKPFAMSPANEQHTDGATATAANRSKQGQEDIAAIDAAIDRMRAFTPTEPYVLTIPQDVEPRYHHSYASQAKQWLHHTPFDYTEHENTQYQTFVYHEPDEMYKLHISRQSESDTNGDASVRKAGTGANTPMASQAPKKTYSLSAYKKKQTGATPDPSAVKEKEAEQAAKKPAVKGPVERIKADEEVLAAVEEDEDVLPHSAPDEAKKDLKRKRGENLTNQEHATQQKHKGRPVEDEAPTKKARRTSPPPQAAEHAQDKSARSEQPAQPVKSSEKSQSHASNPAEQTSLPPKPSPPPAPSEETALPPKLSPMEIPSLPIRLSPTIPSNITATLKARAHCRSASRSSEISGPPSASKDPATRHFTPPPKTVPRNAFRANSSSPAVRSYAEERGRAPASMPPRPKTPDADAQESDEIPVGKKAEKVKRQREYVEERATLVVKLKFKKGQQREAVRRILKMRPNAAKMPVADSSVEEEKVERRPSRASVLRHRARRDTNVKGVAQKVGPASATNGLEQKEKDAKSGSPERKRPRPDESDDSDTAPKKRKKAAPDAIDLKRQEPSTPAASDILSPSSAQKSMSQLTPSTMRKDVLSAAMKREQSTDSRLNTPPAMSQNSPTVNGTSHPVNGTVRASNQPSNKTPKQQAWESEQKRLETLGRELKHAATDHLKTLSLTHSDVAAPSNEQKLAAIKSLESLLAYILAFTCADEAALAADPKMNPSAKPWRSLHGFFGFVKRHCEHFPPLLGLACWLGVVFNARILELATQHPAEAGPSRDSILETQAMMQRAANEADAKLDVDLLQSIFPRSWEGRFKGSLAAERVEVGKSFAGLYKLPLGLQTSPLRAARAGYAMLEEWVEKEGGEGLYMLKLRL